MLLLVVLGLLGFLAEFKANIFTTVESDATEDERDYAQRCNYFSVATLFSIYGFFCYYTMPVLTFEILSIRDVLKKDFQVQNEWYCALIKSVIVAVFPHHILLWF